MSARRITEKPRIRLARAGDLAALLRLQQMFETNRLKRRALANSLRSASQLVLVAEQGENICASAIAFFRRGSRGVRLYDLAVAAETRRAGVGSALVRTIERRARDAGAASVHLEVRTDNASAQEFYRRNGYAAFGGYDGYYEDGCAALRMRKALMDRRVPLAPLRHHPACSPGMV